MTPSPTSPVARPTDHSNLDLDQLNLDVAFGKAGGKVIWQPRILAWYSDKIFAGEPLPAPYTGMSIAQLYRALGCSNRVYNFNDAFKREEDPDVKFSRRDINAAEYEARWDTPVGNQRAVYRISKNSPWHEPLKWPISTESEMKVAAWRAERIKWSWDQAAFERVAAEIYSHIPGELFYPSFSTVEYWERLARQVLFDTSDFFQKRVFKEEIKLEAGKSCPADWKEKGTE
ncbi:MAG: hypothetical protein HY360_13005 [Verrucomicrobia bacterium]|nr:hypothetical protein [Verrucomicrobiota bacterium]